MNAAAAEVVNRCPRCDHPFACGAAGPTPCACTTVPLSATLQARLRADFNGCLCLPCLQALAAQDQAGSTSPNRR